MITEKEFEELFDKYILEQDLPIRKATKPNGEVVYLGIRLKTEEERNDNQHRVRQLWGNKVER